MSSLVDFLLARIAEDERAQNGSTGDADWHEFQCDINRKQEDGTPYPCDCGIPDRVRADCAARRRILKLHKPRGVQGVHVWTCTVCDHAPVRWDHYLTFPCETLRALASVYSDHPDFDPGWGITE